MRLNLFYLKECVIYSSQLIFLKNFFNSLKKVLQKFSELNSFNILLSLAPYCSTLGLNTSLSYWPLIIFPILHDFWYKFSIFEEEELNLCHKLWLSNSYTQSCRSTYQSKFEISNVYTIKLQRLGIRKLWQRIKSFFPF